MVTRNPYSFFPYIRLMTSMLVSARRQPARVHLSMCAVCFSIVVARLDPRYQSACMQAGKGPSIVVHASRSGPLRRSVQRSYRLCGVHPKTPSCTLHVLP